MPTTATLVHVIIARDPDRVPDLDHDPDLAPDRVDIDVVRDHLLPDPDRDRAGPGPGQGLAHRDETVTNRLDVAIIAGAAEVGDTGQGPDLGLGNF